MGVFDNPTVSKTPAEIAAEQLVSQARSTFSQLALSFNRSSQMFWRNPRATPAEIAAALGTNAVELFTRHGQIGALLASINPAAIQQGLAVVGDYTANEDGTITIPPAGA